MDQDYWGWREPQQLSIAQPTFSAPIVTSDRTIVYEIEATNNGVSDTDRVTITVVAPDAAAETWTFSVSGHRFQLQAFVAGFDRFGDTSTRRSGSEWTVAIYQ